MSLVDFQLTWTREVKYTLITSQQKYQFRFICKSCWLGWSFFQIGFFLWRLNKLNCIWSFLRYWHWQVVHLVDNGMGWHMETMLGIWSFRHVQLLAHLQHYTEIPLSIAVLDNPIKTRLPMFVSHFPNLSSYSRLYPPIYIRYQ